MTQEELSEKYMGKNIEIFTSDDEEVVWMFNVRSVATVDTKKENDEVILRPVDKVTVFETPEKLKERIIDYLNKRLLCDPEKK